MTYLNTGRKNRKSGRRRIPEKRAGGK